MASFCFNIVQIVDDDRLYCFTRSLTRTPRSCLSIISCFISIDIILFFSQRTPFHFLFQNSWLGSQKKPQKGDKCDKNNTTQERRIRSVWRETQVLTAGTSAGWSRSLGHLVGASGNSRNLDFLSYVEQDFCSKDISYLEFLVSRVARMQRFHCIHFAIRIYLRIIPC